jgi:hypothetical protein
MVTPILFQHVECNIGKFSGDHEKSYLSSEVCPKLIAKKPTHYSQAIVYSEYWASAYLGMDVYKRIEYRLKITARSRAHIPTGLPSTAPCLFPGSYV